MTTQDRRTLAAVAAELRALAESLAELATLDEQAEPAGEIQLTLRRRAPEPAPDTQPLPDRPRPRCPLCGEPLVLIEVWDAVADSEDDWEGVLESPDAADCRPPASAFVWRCPLRHVPGQAHDDE
jgi:hypothetical protein